MSNLNSKDIKVERFKLFYFYAIDLGYLVNKKDIEKLQTIRSKNQFYSKILNHLDNSGSSGGPDFQPPFLEKQSIKIRNSKAKEKKGKEIWTDLFYDKHVPIIFRGTSNIQLSPVMKNIKVGEYFEIPEMNDTSFKFERTSLRVFPEGTLSISFEFHQDKKSTKLCLEDLFSILNLLQHETENSILFKLKELVKDWSNSKNAFQKIGLQLINPQDIDEGLIKTASIAHSCIFLEGLGNINDDSPISVSKIEKEKWVLGILNNADWYKKYKKKYIQDTFSKNVGYRKDEIYLTDKNTSFILLSDYWEKDNSLVFYIDDLTLAIELQIARLAYLIFILYKYIPNNSAANVNKKNLERNVQFVIDMEMTLSNTVDALDVVSIISHGFTRRFISQLNTERNVNYYINAIERRINIVSQATQLQSSVDLAEKSMINDWIIAALIFFVSTVAAVVTGIITGLISSILAEMIINSIL